LRHSRMNRAKRKTFRPRISILRINTATAVLRRAEAGRNLFGDSLAGNKGGACNDRESGQSHDDLFHGLPFTKHNQSRPERPFDDQAMLQGSEAAMRGMLFALHNDWPWLSARLTLTVY